MSSSMISRPCLHRLSATKAAFWGMHVNPSVPYCGVVGGSGLSGIGGASAHNCLMTRANAGVAHATITTTTMTTRTLIIPRQTFKVKGYKPELYLGKSGGCSCGFCKSSFSTSSSNDSKYSDNAHYDDDDDDEKARRLGPPLITDYPDKDVLLNQMEKKNQLLEDEIKKMKDRLDSDSSMHEYFFDEGENKHDPDVDVILENNRNWNKKMLDADPEFFNRIGKPQHPKYLYIGCSDSRVPANDILGLGPGEVFVHRNVGNQVNGSDLNVLSVLEFGVQFLNVKHIIVTGHYDCGAVRAATKKQDLGLLENWLRSIRDVYRIHHSQLTNIKDEEVKHRRLVELNVMEQALNIYKIGCVQRKRKEYAQEGVPAYPKIHAFVFDPKVGLLHKLPINFKKTISQYSDVYNMY